MYSPTYTHTRPPSLPYDQNKSSVMIGQFKKRNTSGSHVYPAPARRTLTKNEIMIHLFASADGALVYALWETDRSSH